MYKNTENIVSMGKLPLFLDGTLDSNNRWVILASKIPWEKIEEIYSKNFKSKRGPNALSSRVAFGSLIIQTKLGISDEETVNHICLFPPLWLLTF